MGWEGAACVASGCVERAGVAGRQSDWSERMPTAVYPKLQLYLLWTLRLKSVCTLTFIQYMHTYVHVHTCIHMYYICF